MSKLMYNVIYIIFRFQRITSNIFTTDTHIIPLHAIVILFSLLPEFTISRQPIRSTNHFYCPIEMTSLVKNVESLNQILDASKTDPTRLFALNFWTAWAEPCIHMNEVFEALASANQNISCWNV